MSLSDEHIVRIGQGDLKAFKEIYKDMFQSLCLYGYKMLSNQAVVSDIVQEAFIIIWNKRVEFNSLVGTRAYLYTVVRNKISDHAKNLKTVSIENNPVEEIDFNNQITKEETYKILREAIATLPGQTQKVIKLSMNGHTNPEIAEVLDISVNTVKTLKKIGYSKLRELLKDNVFLLLLLADLFGY
ncbi:sigma-70 family RNA polymerase sigma factor [Ancylomarina sp. DW003]|nr:sigma-70 family RNA polymerase sigma factor [Ancylomarina sp. DW003]MDE5423914.1 sigma-70 family RNA polymerase sigma factor [Ancylomarina sp. DW003]